MADRFLWLSFLIILVVQGCNKKVIPKSTTPDTIGVQTFDFNTFQGKGKLHYTHGNVTLQNIDISIRIKQNDIIWINFSSLGIPGARMLITRDSISWINFINKSYNVFDYPSLCQRFNFTIDYPMIEALLVGNPTKPQVAVQEGTEEKPDSIIMQQTTDSFKIITHILASTRRIGRVEFYKLPSNNSLYMAYSHFQPIDNQLFPKKSELNLHYSTTEKTSTFKVTIAYTSIKRNNEDIKFPFRIPKQYDRR